jgi:predicted AAA+ superfamily ATPase
MIRNLFDKLQRHLDKKEFTIITGARQTGKSTLMRQLADYSAKNMGPTVFLNLENRPILADLNLSPFNLLLYIPDTEKRVFVFIDEIQYLDEPSHFLELLYDKYANNVKIIATGSSAFYMDDSFSDSVAGRKRIFWLKPCAFDEYLKLCGKEELLNEITEIRLNANYKTTHLEILRQEWENFMLFGGYPAVITEPDREEKILRLAEIRDSYLKRDILETGVQNEIAFFNLFHILASQIGNLLNVKELSVTLRIKNETVANYLKILQTTFHIALVKPFFQNIRKELIKMPKVYLFDSGMRNSLLNNFQPFNERMDKGMIWENMIFRLLCEKHNTDDIFFWRTANGNEIDFILPQGVTPQAIECKVNADAINEIKYKKFTENYPHIPLSFYAMKPFQEDFFRTIVTE